MSETLQQPIRYGGGRTPRRAVVAMFFLNGSLYGIWASRVPAIAEMHQLSESLLGILLLSMAAGAIVSFPLAGKLVDLYGSADVTKKISFAYGATLVALAVAPNVWLLGLSLFLFGAAHGSMDVSMNAWAGEVERHLKKPIMSSFHAMWSLGTGAGAASGYFAVRLGAEPMVHFLVAASFCLALSLYFGLIPWDSPKNSSKQEEEQGGPEQGASPKRKKQLFPLPQGALAIAGIIGFCSALGEGGMADWSAIFLVQVTSVDEGIAALGFATFSVVMVVMRLVGDKIITRLGVVRSARMSSFAAICGSLLAILAGTLPAALCGFALMGVGYALVFPLIFSRAANDDKLPPGAAIASVATFGYGGGLLGPVLIGFLADIFFIRWAFLLLSALAVLIAILAPVLEPPAAGRAK